MANGNFSELQVEEYRNKRRCAWKGKKAAGTFFHYAMQALDLDRLDQEGDDALRFEAFGMPGVHEEVESGWFEAYLEGQLSCQQQLQ
jgi:hypothetical protein